MQIESLQIENYKGFAQSPIVRFGPGFNVLVGQNNSGKSALLETLRLNGTRSVPHRSVEFEVGSPLPPNSTISATYVITGQELRKAIIRNGSAAVPIPVNRVDQVDEFLNDLFGKDQIRIPIKAVAGAGVEPVSYPSYAASGITDVESGGFYSLIVSVSGDRQRIDSASVRRDNDDNLSSIIAAAATSSTYVFDAQRLNIGQYPASEQKLLDTSARNLPAVLQGLSANPAKYERFCGHVTEIFPNIRWVSVFTVGNQFEIRIWPVQKDTERDDLALSLLEGGTGVGQVLAILLVAMTMTNSIIAIDEPNNFLHPGAVKKLIGILNTYSSNQYIISTHSTDAVLYSDPSSLHLVKWTDGKSDVSTVNIESVAELRQILGEIGTSLSDVFGPDKIIWVEGETEQFCFPEICRTQLGGVPLGLSFLPLRSTADVETNNKNAEKALGIYDRISSLGAIIPPAVAFSFDRELRSPQDVDDLKRRARRTLVLGRRTIENYLINGHAIAYVISNETKSDVEGEKVNDWILQNLESYIPPKKFFWPGDTWIKYVDAPSLISDAFDHFSESTLEFRKTRHSLMLLAWIQQYDQQEISELTDFVRDLIAVS
ncbi:MAG: AAA family ATPase [Brevundimonas sp.]|nr:AAA family ATPase [Brevundimonas sp.]